jgi:hypothetical protein
VDEQIRYQMSIWKESLEVSHDLLCVHCGAMGPFLWTYCPLEVHHQRTTNPMIAICTVCNRGTTFEGALTLKNAHDELKKMFSAGHLKYVCDH